MEIIVRGVKKGRRKDGGGLLLLYLVMVVAQIPNSNTTTHPAEARAINAIFSQWGISEELVTRVGWNLSGDPCTGAPIDSTEFGDFTYNPALKCDCSFPNSTCRITALKVYALDVVGPIPEQLWTLSYLLILTISINALSGEIPRELERLNDLRLLSFSGNNFTGSLPSELGNLTRLEQIYIDSSGVSGEIPSTFSNLRNLVTVWASDNEFTRRIPDFIGNWSKLEALRFQGNSFQGSISSTFSRLASLTDLRVSDLLNGSSSLGFLADLRSLSVLMLRNNRISGSIPANIGEYQNLMLLDLSFNRLTGQIPTDLFNLSQISYLFLGNNNLNGTLPNAKGVSLRNIDLSYNGLFGTLPSWVNERNLQLNLVANNFTLGDSENSVLPLGLNCLQGNFTCNRGTTRYSDFVINCGGPEITSSHGLVHEQDNETLGPATSYVTSASRWGVSNVGQRDNPIYIASSSHQFTNTVDSELFQTARLSAGSLRYYGLGLENGNYTVTLQFAELVIENGPTWRSLGRRVFDIYLQGNRLWQNFDIKREAGGDSFKPVSKEATIEVSENYLEVHLFWAGKGTCCVPNQGTFGPIISAIRATPNFVPSVSNNPSFRRNNRNGLIIGIFIHVAVVSLLSLWEL